MVEAAEEDKIYEFIKNPNYELSEKQSSESITLNQVRQVERFQAPTVRKSLTEVFNSAATSLANSASKITLFKLRANKNPIGRSKIQKKQTATSFLPPRPKKRAVNTIKIEKSIKPVKPFINHAYQLFKKSPIP